MGCAKFGQVFNKYLFFAKKEAEKTPENVRWLMKRKHKVVVSICIENVIKQYSLSKNKQTCI